MLWKKDTEAAAWVTRFTVGEDYQWDYHLLPYDVQASRAHAWGLAQIGILTEKELAAIEGGLDDLVAAFNAGNVVIRPEDEDCHTVIEVFLTERLGDVGKKIHTGRSRNDQVLAALRLWLRERVRVAAEASLEIAEALCTLAEGSDDVLMPGYTHYQRAMPSTPALWALGYAELLVSDLEALRAAYDQINTSPLGSAAGYGVPHLDLPRRAVAERLGFTGIQTHVTAVQLSRGKLELHVVHAFAQVTATLNRLASDLVAFNSAEFGFVTLPRTFCTGSSIMPQKQNPDVLELVRAGYHRVTAEMQVLINLPANLPSGYHRDLQLTKEAVMRATLATSDLLTAMANLLPGVRFDLDRLAMATTPELFATEKALELVRAGMPFREAYREAARTLKTLEVPSAETALAAYTVAGFPGRTNPGLIRDLLAPYRSWAETSNPSE